jgi:hypothetical protein
MKIDEEEIMDQLSELYETEATGMLSAFELAERDFLKFKKESDLWNGLRNGNYQSSDIADAIYGHFHKRSTGENYLSKPATKLLKQTGREKMMEGRVKSLLSKPVKFEGRTITKGQMVESMVRSRGMLRVDSLPKHIFSRAKFNRIENEAQRIEYEEKLKTKMPYAVELPDGTYYEITQTEAEYFLSLGGKS